MEYYLLQYPSFLVSRFDTVVDIVFYIHTPSNKNDSAPEEKYFVNSMIEDFDISENKARVAILTAGMSPSSFRANLTDNMALLQSRIENIDTSEMKGKVTMTSIIGAIVDSFESSGRTDVPQVAFLLTDTVNIEVERNVSYEVDAYREGIKFVAVGVGSSVDKSLLDEFADAESFTMSDFEDLRNEELLMEIANEASPGKLDNTFYLQLP